MSWHLSVYPWDIVIDKKFGTIFLDLSSKQTTNYLTINESSLDPPSEKEKLSSPNHPGKLSKEATYTNLNFVLQTTKSGTLYQVNDLLSNHNDSEELTPSQGLEEGHKRERGFVYRMYEMEENFKMCIRSQVDGYKVKKPVVLAEDLGDLEDPAASGKIKKRGGEDKNGKMEEGNYELLSVKAVNEYKVDRVIYIIYIYIYRIIIGGIF